jgi:hypothetical protein
MNFKLIVPLALVLLIPASFGQKGETPPYDPAPPQDGMSAYTDQNLEMTLNYPKEFVPRTPEDLQAVIERGHRAAYGTDPASDPEHLEAIRCSHTLLYATSDESNENESAMADGDSADTIMVVDFDRSCIPKKLKGDKALTELAGTVLNLPGSVQLVQQMWFAAGKIRRIHSGMAGTMFAPPRCSNNRNSAAGCSRAPLFIIAAAVEQKEHDIVIVYLSGTSGEKHELVRHMSVSFENERPVLLYPFLMGGLNLIK